MEPAELSGPLLADAQLSAETFDPIPDYFARKYWVVRGIGLILFFLASPVILILVVLVRCTSAGPSLYRQRRVGRGGHEYEMYKIRTMYQDAEKGSGPVWCKRADPRITSIGKFLRYLHLDELPQLINVIRGEMDLIGPRPERPEIVEKLVNRIPGYAERLDVLPGVTGLAQLNLPPDENLDSVRRKLVLDTKYIQIASFEIDIKILLCTAIRMHGIRRINFIKMLGLQYPVPDIPASQEDRFCLNHFSNHASYQDGSKEFAEKQTMPVPLQVQANGQPNGNQPLRENLQALNVTHSLVGHSNHLEVAQAAVAQKHPK